MLHKADVSNPASHSLHKDPGSRFWAQWASFPRERILKEFSPCVTQAALIAVSVTLGRSTLVGGLSLSTWNWPLLSSLDRVSLPGSALPQAGAEVTSQVDVLGSVWTPAVCQRRGVGKTLKTM